MNQLKLLVCCCPYFICQRHLFLYFLKEGYRKEKNAKTGYAKQLNINIEIPEQKGQGYDAQIHQKDPRRCFKVRVSKIQQAVVDMVAVGLKGAGLMDKDAYKKDTQGIQQGKEQDGLNYDRHRGMKIRIGIGLCL